MKIGAVGLGNRIAHVYHELSQINKDAELIAYVDPVSYTHLTLPTICSV